MTNFPDLYVLRHGQTQWNLEGRFQGRMDSPLTELGMAQARQQGVILAALELDFDHFTAFCSPQGRAVHTAELAGLKAAPDERLMEISFGSIDGKTLAEIQVKHPEMSDKTGLGWHFNMPDGERFPEMRARCLSFLDDLNGPAVIVCHGITSRLLRGLWMGYDLDGLGRLPIVQGCVYHLSNGLETVLNTAP
ncbi:MAG: histidine phosphatase family protein [Alphaproteobacteria bacterium]|nr:histidine phosphatase family protein [Alphaproteobacteria bacterium]